VSRFLSDNQDHENLRVVREVRREETGKN